MVKGGENAAEVMRAIRFAIERQHNAEELRYLVKHDPLTGAVNKTEFLHQLERLMATADRAEQSVGVLTVDLDRFRSVNELAGYPEGDQVLRDSAQRLRDCLRSDAVVARIDADQFAVAIGGVADERDAELVSERIHSAFATPFEIGDKELWITVSVGITTHPADGESAEALLAGADSAMRYAKEHGRNRTRFLSEDANHRLQRRREVRNGLKAALEHRQLELRFQPRFERDCCSVHSVAASLLWHHPSRGPIGPEGFYLDAESEGLIERIDEYAMEALCGQLRHWATDDSRPFVSLSVSASFVEIPGFPDYIERLLMRRPISPGMLEISVHENALAESPGRTIENLHRIYDLGLRTAISCSATGLASLRHMTHLPLDAINITGALVAELEQYKTAAIVHALVVFAHDLGLSITADGVHNQAHLARVRDLGCDVLQGDHLMKSVGADGLETLLA
jgi:diguanylate cyclase (GGDEF)-like protein